MNLNEVRINYAREDPFAAWHYKDNQRNNNFYKLYHIVYRKSCI